MPAWIDIATSTPALSEEDDAGNVLTRRKRGKGAKSMDALKQAPDARRALPDLPALQSVGVMAARDMDAVDSHAKLALITSQYDQVKHLLDHDPITPDEKRFADLILAGWSTAAAYIEVWPDAALMAPRVAFAKGNDVMNRSCVLNYLSTMQRRWDEMWEHTRLVRKNQAIYTLSEIASDPKAKDADRLRAAKEMIALIERQDQAREAKAAKEKPKEETPDQIMKQIESKLKLLAPPILEPDTPIDTQDDG